MAKNAEANLLIKIKQTGKEAITKVGDALGEIKTQAAVASAALTAFIGFTVKKYSEQEDAEKSLRVALKNQGFEVEALSKRYMDLASAIQAKTTEDDTAIIKGVALAQSYAGQLELTDELIEATVDFAAFTGKDLTEAFSLVGKAIGTSTNALSRNGVELDENMTASEKMDTITKKFTKTYKGFAEAQRDGLGELKALNNTMDDFLENIGKEFVPIINKASKELNGFIQMLSENDVAKYAAAILGVGAAITGLVAALGTLGIALPAVIAGLETLAAIGAGVVAVISGPVGIAVGVLGIATAAAAASGALDGVIGKVKQLTGLGVEPNAKEINDGGGLEDERYLRAVARAKKEGEAKVTANKEANVKISKDDNAAALQGLRDQEAAWQEMKQRKLDFEQQLADEELALRSIAQDQAQEVSRQKFETWMAAFQGIATGGFQGMIGGVVQTIGDAYIPGIGSLIKSFFDLFAKDAETFKLQVAEMFSTTFMDSLVTNAFLFSEEFFKHLPDLFDKAITEIIAQSPKHTATITKTILSEEFIGGLVKSIVMGIVNGVKMGASDIGEAFQKAISDGITQGGKAKEVGKNIASIVKGAPKTFGFANGGLVPNIQHFAAGGTVDTVPAMLSPGEFVMNRDATQKNLGALMAMNSGGSGMSGATINITVNGGFLGDEKSARQFAKAVDEQLLKLRQGNQSVAFDSGVF